MSDSWLMGVRSGDNRILKAVNNDKQLAAGILDALQTTK